MVIFEINALHIWNQQSRICQNAKFHVKQKKKNFLPKMPCLDTFRSEFDKTIAIFEISTLIKIALFGYVLIEISRNYCHVWNPHPGILLGQNFKKTIDIFEYQKGVLTNTSNFGIWYPFSKGPGFTLRSGSGSGSAL